MMHHTVYNFRVVAQDYAIRKKINDLVLQEAIEFIHIASVVMQVISGSLRDDT
jgi:hypothetical protein